MLYNPGYASSESHARAWHLWLENQLSLGGRKLPDQLHSRLREFVALALQCPSDLESADREHEPAFQRLRPFDWVNRGGDWERATQHLDDGSLWRLLKVVVLAERDFKWMGGSAASGIRLYRMLSERCPAAQREMADWVLRHRGDNPYVPLGTTVHARSWDEAQEELHQIRARKAARNAAGARKQAVQTAAAVERRNRHQVVAAEHRAQSAEKNESRRMLIARIAEVSVVERVRGVLDSPLPLDAFPVSLFSEVSDEHAHVPRETLAALRAAIGDRRGAWRNLADVIDRLLDGR